METSSSRLRLLTAIANMKQRCSSIPGIIDASDPRVTPPSLFMNSLVRMLITRFRLVTDTATTTLLQTVCFSRSSGKPFQSVVCGWILHHPRLIITPSIESRVCPVTLIEDVTQDTLYSVLMISLCVRNLKSSLSG